MQLFSPSFYFSIAHFFAITADNMIKMWTNKLLMAFDNIYLVHDVRMLSCLDPLPFPSYAISLVCFETKPVNAIKDMKDVNKICC